MKRLILIYILLIVSISGRSQEKVLSPELFIKIVKENHPISAQSKLLSDMAEAQITSSRGNLDPYLYSNYSQKYYSDKEYYELFEGGLKIPTWYGVEFKAAYVNNSGANLNPENYVEDNGMWMAGVKIPLGNGLIIDKRRAEIKKAQLYVEANEIERKNILNELFYESLQQYWSWVEKYNKLKIYQDALEIADERFTAVKDNFLQGEKPAIDTLEALIQKQNRQIQLNDAKLEYDNQTVELSNYLWDKNLIPLILDSNISAPNFNLELELQLLSLDTIQNLLDNFDDNHPELVLYDNKLEGIKINRRLFKENLKPKLNLNYNILSKEQNSNLTMGIQNYKWGVDFSMPIFLRDARGQLKLNELQERELSFNRQSKVQEIETKIKKDYNKQLNIISQFQLNKNTGEYYLKLLEGEQIKFNSGESSLFLINSRENKLIEAQLKLIELYKKYRLSNIEIFKSAGILYQL